MKDDVSRNGYTAKYIERLDKERESVKDANFIEVLDGIKKEYKVIDRGAVAPEIVFTDLEDQTVKLSDFKGKVIVVDLWATWCGPCMTEKPYFEKIEEKYSSSSDIVFLTVSIDKMKIWKSYFKKKTPQGHQLQVYRADLSEYKIAGIPRFFVIDRDFKIVSAFAPLPSSGDLEEMIKEALN